MSLLPRMLSAVLVSLPLVLPVAAQDQEPERIPFADGELTITETPDFEKVLAFDGRELARDYFAFFDRIADVGGTDVAFFYIGPGGNACAPSVAMVWKPEEGPVTLEMTEADCTTPPPAISESAVFFIPYLLPGEPVDVTSWAPGQGFSLHGRIAYAPQPGTSWATFDAAAIGHPLDLFRNADVHAAALELLGDQLGTFAAGLGTAGEPDIAPDGMLVARGCVPHACGMSDSFVVVDPMEQAIYFAQKGDRTRFWPAREEWPSDVSALVPNDF
ncbi:hypothetical protein ABGN05_08585 [Aquibium sp. LZ166]|uniref:Uncharacterized protein n=1 Tax=Aquibium pacificus TaxID=3153579 RepID=A0ABV3SHB9_9HYPH